MDPALRRLFGPGRPMVGRDRELAVLVDAYHHAGNVPAVVVITGEAGIGKSRLVAEFLAELPTERSVTGSCQQLAGQPLPFAAIEDAWQQLARVTPGPPSLQPVPRTRATASQLHQFEHWLDLIEGRGDRSGYAVLVVEDLQWADESTLAFLTMVARSLPRRRVMLVMTRRDDQPAATHTASDALAELLRVPHLQTIALPRLTADQVGELALFLCDDTFSPATVTQLWDRSQGNPYLLIELAAAGGEVPLHVQDVLLARVKRLHGDSQVLVRLAAVAGLSVDDDLLWSASSMDGDRYLAAARAAVNAGVLLPEAGRYVFRHSLTRDALMAQLLPLELRRLHGSIAEALESTVGTGDTARLAAIAVHWKVAGERHRAFPAARAAGRQAFAVHAYAEAWRHYQWALELTEFADPRPDRSELLTEAAEAARWSGDVSSGVRLLREALLEATDAADQARWYERLGRYLWEAGASAESHAAFSAALELLEPVPESPVRPPVLAARARASAIMTSYAQAAEEAQDAVEAARRAGLPEVEADALTTLGMVTAMLRTGDGAALIRQALERLHPEEHLETICRSYANLTFVLEHEGRHDEACDVALHGLEVVGRHGLQLGAGAALASNTAAILFSRGRYDECETLLAGLLAESTIQGQALHLFVERAGLQAARGQTAAARASLQLAAELATTANDPWVVASLVVVEAELLLHEGQFDLARETVVSGWQRVVATEDDEIRARLCRMGLQVEADRLARWDRTTDPTDLDCVTWLAAQIPEARPEETAPDTVAECRTAHAEAARAERRDSPDTWRQAGDLWREVQRPRDQAYCRLREAERAAEQRLAQRAAAAAEEASELATKLGARPILAGVDALRRRARLPNRRPVKAARAAERSLPSGLTVREQQVLELIGQGATNRAIGHALFISERTAAVHVSSILRKLGVDNRVQAAALLPSIVRTPQLTTS